MKRLGWILGCLVLAGAAHATTPVPPAAVTAATLQLLLDAWPKADPDDPTDLPPPAPALTPKLVRAWLKSGALRPVKISPDPRPDWLIDTEKLDGAEGYYCGTGGCSTEIWSPSPTGYVRTFDNQVREIRFHWIKGRTYTWIEVDFHGSVCGTFGAAACPFGFEWRSADGGLATSWRFAKGDIFRPGAPPQPLNATGETDGASRPAELTRFAATQAAACRAGGGDFAEADVAARMPDLNHDGIDDWLYGGDSYDCTLPDADAAPSDACAYIACTTIIWLSRREDGGRLDWDETPLDITGIVGWRYHKKTGRVDLVELDNPPGVADGDDGACDVYTLSQCVEKTISLSPKP